MEKMANKRRSLWTSFVKWGNDPLIVGPLRIVLFSIVMIVLGSDGLAQAAMRSFRITSFSINGNEVTNFEVFFLLNGKYRKPDRLGNTILVPFEIQEASAASSGIRFVSSNLDFTYDNLAFGGYVDSDEVKSDYRVEANTDPAIIKRLLKQMSNKSRRGLGIYNSRDICAVFALTRLPRLRENSILIADPVTLTRVQRCGSK